MNLRGASLQRTGHAMSSLRSREVDANMEIGISPAWQFDRNSA
jgi:hypothetical protein